jgi:hypothetical protein
MWYILPHFQAIPNESDINRRHRRHRRTIDVDVNVNVDVNVDGWIYNISDSFLLSSTNIQ